MNKYSKIVFALRSVTEGSSLRSQVAKGAFWMSAFSALENGIRFLRNIILTRLLLPEAFGTMGILLAVTIMFESFTEMGIRQAVVQNPHGKETSFLNGAWWTAVVRAILIFTIGFLVSPWLADFYNRPELKSMLQVAFIGVIFQGLMSAKAYVALKELDYLKWGTIYHGGALLGVIIAVPLAILTHSVWALVFSYIAESGFRTGLSYLFCPFRPRWQFERQHLHNLFKYSRGLIGLPILYFLYKRADIFVVGKMCSGVELGLYTIAVGLARAPFQYLQSLLAQLGMPAFSQLQFQKDIINEAIVKVTLSIVVIGFPILVFSGLYGREMLSLIYGPAYGHVHIPFAIACAAEWIQVMGVVGATAYFSLGKPEFQRKVSAMRLLVLAILIVPGIKLWGLSGATAAVLVAVFVGLCVQMYHLRSFTQLKIWYYKSLFATPILAASLLLGVNAASIICLEGKKELQLIIAGVTAVVYSWHSLLLLKRQKYGNQNKETVELVREVM